MCTHANVAKVVWPQAFGRCRCVQWWFDLHEDLVSSKQPLDDLAHQTALCRESIHVGYALLLVEVPFDHFVLSEPGTRLGFTTTDVHAQRALDLFVLLV